MNDDAVALIDTNILVYAYDDTDKTKWKIASSLLEKVWRGEARCAVSTQNLTEFYIVITSKIKNPVPKEEAEGIVCDIVASRSWKVIAPDKQCLLEAISIERKHGIHFWDAHIIAAARKGGVAKILTENVKDFSMPGIIAENPLR